ncbi:hypothetical protein GGI20_000127 [Coemansia sp. BCRC 34301]|nr:hypothetical protein GGI20_000127 [Coemansia sp. BCRC 34301]
MPKKPLSVSVPAALNLKAELERARQECKEGTSGSGRAAKRPKTTSLALGADRQNKGVQDRAQRDKQHQDSERLSSTLSSAWVRQILEEKAKLYDLLSTGGDGSSSLRASQLDDPHIAQILDEGSVDFATKQLEHARRIDELQSGGTTAGSDGRDTHVADASLVEIVDEFGRTRMVPRSEAHRYRRRSSSVASSSGNSSAASSESDSEHGSLSHRSRGLGYYNLPVGADERREQIKALQLLHKHTVLTREEAVVSIADKQKQHLEERRAKLRASRTRFVVEP